MLRTMRVREWRWNADARRWELADTGEEFGLGDVLSSVPLPGPVGLLAIGTGLIAAIVRWARHRSQASTLKKRVWATVAWRTRRGSPVGLAGVAF